MFDTQFPQNTNHALPRGGEEIAFNADCQGADYNLSLRRRKESQFLLFLVQKWEDGGAYTAPKHYKIRAVACR